MAQFSTDRNALLNNNKDVYEVVMVSGQAGPSVYVPAGNLNAASDAFGRLRTSQPFTLFDSSFRYADSERRWNTAVSGSATYTFNADQGLMDLDVTDADGDEIVRQTDRVFAYQPGKSLLVMNTFTMNEAKANLRQRVGYFTKDNGIYVEQDGTTTYLVKRSAVSGSVVNTRIAQGNWNVDKLNGTGPSGETLDMSKSQILWTDFEWLGVGSVRMGFVINGQFICCHIFHHANEITGTYITTASLSCRYEITNTGATSGASQLKQICSTVLSEGGYNQIGLTRSATNPITGKNLTNGINNPMVSIRLRSGRTDAVVLPRDISLYGIQATPFLYKIIRGGIVNNANWTLTDSSSSVEYDISGDSITNGTVLFEGVFKGQTSSTIVDLQEKFNNSIQLTRGIITGDSVGNTLTIAVVPTTNNDDAVVALTWQERTS
jgi:hypothetical protein